MISKWKEFFPHLLYVVSSLLPDLFSLSLYFLYLLFASWILTDFQLDTSHVDQIRQHFLFLRENMFVDPVLTAHLEQLDVLSVSERQILQNENISEKRNDKLLTLIMRKSSEEYQRFLKSLQLTGQGHIVQQLNQSWK